MKQLCIVLSILSLPVGGAALAWDPAIGVITRFGHMPYLEGYDCDDYAWCCYHQLTLQGLDVWQVSINLYDYGTSLLIERRPRPSWAHERFCYVDGAGGAELLCWSQFSGPADPPTYIQEMTAPVGHVLNIVENEMGSPPPNQRLFCFYEPQSDETTNCWLQPDTDTAPNPPASAVDALGDWYSDNWYMETNHSASLQVGGISVFGSELCPIAGEEAFTEDPDLVEAYETSTGYSAPEVEGFDAASEEPAEP